LLSAFGRSANLSPVRRALRERFCQCKHVDAVPDLKGRLAYLMLLGVVTTTQADRPSVRRL
jgi:hypothetical protein